MKNKKLSVVLATFNEEKNITSCLDSVKDLADEIVVVDGSSQDGTVKLAKKFTPKVFVVSNQMMFHKNKQLALEKATADWILQLDADEKVSKDLAKEIQSLISTNDLKESGFYIPRKNYFLGAFLKKGGQYPDYVIRLVKKDKAYFPCKSVHEQIVVNGSLGYLKKPLLHFSSPSFGRYWQNANRYTTLTAKKLLVQKNQVNPFNFLNFIFFKPWATFINIFILNKGFVDGIRGFLFAFFSALHWPVAYFKFLKKKNSGDKFNLKQDWQ